jgi:hypothetical protein
MKSTGWQSLLDMMTGRHENLALVLANGAQVCVHTINRSEPEYLVVRGRLLGTVEDNGFYIVPFDQIMYLSLPRTTKESDVRKLFGETSETDAASAQPVAVEAETPAGMQRLESAGIAGGTGVDKASLLERLRARRSKAERPPMGSS